MTNNSINNLNSPPLLEVKNLGVSFFTPRGTVRAVRDASFTVRRGEVVGLVGESGCGKSTVAYSIMGYLPGIVQVDGEILYDGRNLVGIDESELESLRGNRIAMVYQDPQTSLNPTMKIGPQMEEVLKTHLDIGKQEIKAKAVELFESVGLASPDTIGERYPHELSGGMQQRVVIALALACEPDLLIMDEPTTGLDVTTEATILDLIVDLKDRVNAGILFVSHNLGVIARVADRVTVMYASQTVEDAPVKSIFNSPQHPYTAGLLSCVPKPANESGITPRLKSIPGSVFEARLEAGNECLFAPRCPIAKDECTQNAPQISDTDDHRVRCFFPDEVTPDIWGELRPRRDFESDDNAVVIQADDLNVRYRSRQGKKYILFGAEAQPPVRAVVDANFKVTKSRTLGIVGESGSGKSTTARALIGLTQKSSGSMLLNGDELETDSADRTSEQRADLRMVFQNPTASLNPKLPIKHAITRSLKLFGGLDNQGAYDEARALLEAVGLNPDYIERIPSELSGGEQQRVALASAFAANPKAILADEAVSALDVSVQAQVLNLLLSNQQENETSFVFISHDLGVVRYVSDDIMVMYAGHVAEQGPADDVLSAPSHPYTEALLSAAPEPDPDATPSIIRLDGAVPTMRERFTGCFFADRCHKKIDNRCDEVEPPAQAGNSPDHIIRCHIPVDELVS